MASNYFAYHSAELAELKSKIKALSGIAAMKERKWRDQAAVARQAEKIAIYEQEVEQTLKEEYRAVTISLAQYKQRSGEIADDLFSRAEDFDDWNDKH